MKRIASVYWLIAGCLAGAEGATANMVDNSRRTEVAGVDLITYRTNVKQVVNIVGALPAGDAMAGSGNIAAPSLTGMMLDRGTKKLDKFAIAEQLESVGAQITFNVGTQSLEIRAKCLKKDLPMVLGLIAAELRTPALSEAEFAKARDQFIGALDQSLQNTGARAQEAFDRAIFPEGHPNRPHTVDEYIAAAKAATLDDVRKFHAQYIGPAHLTLVLAGDVPVEEAAAEVRKDFSGWTGGTDYIRPATPAAPKSAAQNIDVPLNDKPSVSMILGQASGLRYRDPDSLALRVGTAILGRGFTGRLMGTVRDKEGLTYGIGATLSEDSIADGAWNISATFAPALLEKGLASTRRVLDSWWRDGVTDAELASHKQGIVGSYSVSLSTTAGIAGTIMATVQRGYALTWLDEYPKAVNAMTREQVNKAIHSHLDPATMVLVEAGSVGSAATP